MDAPVRYPEVFTLPREGAPESFWISLGYFNLYRIALATLFLTITLIYGDALNLGSHSLALFRTVCAAYLVLGIVFQAVLRSRQLFNAQLTMHASLDILAIIMLMYASGGMLSALGGMLLISLIGAAIVAPMRLSFLYASLATIALLLEQGYWVLAHDLPSSNFLQPGLAAIGCFAVAGATSWLAQRVATNERLARKRGRELETQTRVNQLVIQDMHDGVVVLDREGRVVQFNPQAQRLLRAEALLGAEMARLVPGFDGHWLAWRAGEESEASFDVELGGREMRLRLLDAGTEEGYAVTFIDDTTRTREQAQQFKLAALGRLTANIAHEIRNPLAAISHASELLREEKRGEDRARLTRIIHDNTQRLERLVADVMQLNRRDRISAEAIALRPWLAAFSEEFVANESVDASRLTVDALGEPSVRFDRQHLTQVMWNLLRNAVRYAPGKAGSVRIVLREFAGRVEISVLDEGPGVPPAIQGQLFEPFFTTEAKGTGLGLYLARELCAANRATLEYVDDTPGAHFRIQCREARA